MPNKIINVLGVIPEVLLCAENGKKYIVIVVPKQNNLISYHGHYYIRSGSTTRELKGNELTSLMLKKFGLQWDGDLMPDVKISDLSNETFDLFRKLAKSSGRLSSKDLEVSNEEILIKLNLFENNTMRQSSVLLFHQNPQKFFNGAFIKIGYFRSESELIYHDEIYGNLFQQSLTILDLLFSKYLKAVIRYEGIFRIEEYPIDKEALREAVLNAIIHRNYKNHTPIQIRVYDDRLVIWNPAVLTEEWTQNRFIHTHPSNPLNPGIANTFFRAGEIEAWGRGINQIRLACKNAGAPEPLWKYEDSWLLTEITFPDEYTKIFKTPNYKTPANTSLEISSSTGSSSQHDNILNCIRKNPAVRLHEIADILDMSLRTVERRISQLRKQGRLQRIGGSNGGAWKVVDE